MSIYCLRRKFQCLPACPSVKNAKIWARKYGSEAEALPVLAFECYVPLFPCIDTGTIITYNSSRLNNSIQQRKIDETFYWCALCAFFA